MMVGGCLGALHKRFRDYCCLERPTCKMSVKAFMEGKFLEFEKREVDWLREYESSGYHEDCSALRPLREKLERMLKDVEGLDVADF